MFWQIWTAVLVALTGFGSLTVATAQETKAANGQKQITNSIGMKLVLIPKGEFKMGSGESAEDTAAFFKKTYGEVTTAFFTKTYGENLRANEFKDEHPQHRVRITKPFFFGIYHVTCADNFGGLLTTPATRRTRRRTRIRGPSVEPRQEGVRGQ